MPEMNIEQHDTSKTLVTKSQLMQAIAEGKFDESFSHTLYGCFNITKMREQCLARLQEYELVPIDAASIAFLRSHRDVDEARVVELSEDSALNDPGMIVYYGGEDGCLMIDGTHRAIRRFEHMGSHFMRFWIIDPKDIIVSNDGSDTGMQWGKFELRSGDQNDH